MKTMFLILVMSLSLFAKTNYGDVKVDEVTSIYDGDTFRVNINKYPSIIGKKMAIRVNGIDTPEMRGKCKKEKTLARAAKKFTVNFLRTCKKDLYLKNMQRGKYFRVVADVYCGNKSLTKELIKNNHAVEYHGGTKAKNWCK
ncbi:thermonuclease family protein [Malaciobacter marinus]|uniref:thermonuclease family protein n=1 Tax=Malaciobacter marinus TaxID=505249 RepID=UPI003B00E0C2